MNADKKKLVVLIPAYNESKTIGAVIKAIPRDCIDEVKVLVVDDGSTDGTSEVAKSAGADYILRFHSNRGLGAAFRAGIDKALELGTDYIVNIDADMQFNPADIPKLIKPLLNGEADFTVCSRFMDKRLEPKMPWIKKFGNKVFSRLIGTLTGVKLTDTQSGFRAYTRDAALQLNILSDFTYTQESLINLIENGMKVKEIPCEVKERGEGKSKVVDSVILYTLRSITILVRTIRDYRPLEFFGGIGAATFSTGFITGLFVVVKWLATGKTGGHQGLISVSILLTVIGFMFIVMALQADMNTRYRRMLEEIIRSKKESL